MDRSVAVNDGNVVVSMHDSFSSPLGSSDGIRNGSSSGTRTTAPAARSNFGSSSSISISISSCHDKDGSGGPKGGSGGNGNGHSAAAASSFGADGKGEGGVPGAHHGSQPTPSQQQRNSNSKEGVPLICNAYTVFFLWLLSYPGGLAAAASTSSSGGGDGDRASAPAPSSPPAAGPSPPPATSPRRWRIWLSSFWDTLVLLQMRMTFLEHSGYLSNNVASRTNRVQPRPSSQQQHQRLMWWYLEWLFGPPSFMLLSSVMQMVMPACVLTAWYLAEGFNFGHILGTFGIASDPQLQPPSSPPSSSLTTSSLSAAMLASQPVTGIKLLVGLYVYCYVLLKDYKCICYLGQHMFWVLIASAGAGGGVITSSSSSNRQADDNGGASGTGGAGGTLISRRRSFRLDPAVRTVILMFFVCASYAVGMLLVFLVSLVLIARSASAVDVLLSGLGALCVLEIDNLLVYMSEKDFNETHSRLWEKLARSAEALGGGGPCGCSVNLMLRVYTGLVLSVPVLCTALLLNFTRIVNNMRN
ncbi:hypothetical protein PLESTB_000657900 [Pleodorina starrii]|uniref:Uncharacterized protein n=1 Tax=Pleodorina starrii TaxID=330485 RepID=A0A9W6F1A7_9CHLO|nr:hypothetical protein PLESTM_001322500 [Pleodorina starrii]GLC52692.1 hypothetical protein PLESTB_000657900 [Pleodorina starrii]GLC71697.1 hypothetical protein PLESTF_001150700 [Pleodorina starrii]